MMLLKCYTQCVSKFGKLSSSHRTGKRQFSFQYQRRANNVQTKQCSNCSTIVLISQASKFMLKIVHARLQQCVNRELADIQAGFQRGSRTRNHIAKFCCCCCFCLFVCLFCITEKGKEFQKNIYLCFTDYGEDFDCVGYNKLWKILKEMGIPDHLSCMQIKWQQLELDMEQLNGSKLGKEYNKTVYCHPAYLTYMQGTSCEMPCWMNHKLESRLL